MINMINDNFYNIYIIMDNLFIKTVFFTLLYTYINYTYIILTPRIIEWQFAMKLAKEIRNVKWPSILGSNPKFKISNFVYFNKY